MALAIVFVCQLLPYCTEAENGGLNDELAFHCDLASKHMSDLGAVRLFCPVFTRVDSKKKRCSLLLTSYSLEYVNEARCRYQKTCSRG